MHDGPHRDLGNPERNDARRMAVHDGIDVRPRLVDLAVNETLDEHAAAVLIDRIGIEVEFHDVVGGHQSRRDRAGHQVPVWVGRMTDADMAESIHHALVSEDAAGGDEVFDDRGIDGATRSRLRGRRLARAGHCKRGKDDADRHGFAFPEWAHFRFLKMPQFFSASPEFSSAVGWASVFPELGGLCTVGSTDPPGVNRLADVICPIRHVSPTLPRD